MKDRILARRARFMAATLAACSPGAKSQTVDVAGPIAVPSVQAAPQPPDPDEDGDGIPDRLDKCPTIGGVVREDGCPARPCLSIGTHEVRILQRVEFPAGQSTLVPAAFPMLDEVAAFLKGNTHVIARVQGHSDSTENVSVAASRELVVRAYLEKKGVDPKQLEHVTYGSTRPIAPNGTADGRQKNRRVDFEITQQ
jgi:outer membrane protein OmpA-like peptidoglycan-associated protein